MPLAFSSPWARAWCAELNASATYRTAAAAWEGSVALAAAASGATLGAAFLDLWHGECRAARAATPEDLAAATYVIEADPATWRSLLGGALSPVAALLTGRLRLARGQLAALLPHAQAAQELLRLADRIETLFPEDW